MASSTAMSGFSGIDTQSIINALMSIEQGKLTRAQAARSKMVATDNAWTNIVSKLNAINTASTDLLTPTRFLTTTATSSDPTKVTVAGSPAAGTYAFGVTRLASASMWEVGGLSSPVAEVGAGSVALNRGLASMGLSDATGTAGEHTLLVTQASAKAALANTFTGATLAAPATLNIDLATPSGTTRRTVTLAAGAYASAGDLAAAVNGALGGASGLSVGSSGDTMTITNTAGEGSQYTVTLSGSAVADLGLATTSQAGTDAVVAVDGQSTTITAVSASSSFTVGSPSGPMTLTASSAGHLSVGNGSSRIHEFAAGTTIDTVAATLNGAGSPVNAVVVGSAGSASMLVTSKTTGAAANTSVSWSGFAAGSAAMLREGADAAITLGSKTITSATNVLTNVLPGATLTLLGTTAGSEVSVTTSKDMTGAVSKVKSFVSALNDALGSIDSATRTNPADINRAGPLAGNGTARSLRRSLVDAVTEQAASGTYRSLAEIGVSISRTGTFSVNETTLKAALEKDPDAVTAVVSRSVAAADTRVRLSGAQSGTVAGDYAVSITRAATRASVSGSVFGSLAAPETLTVTYGSQSATYTAAAGMSAAQVITGLNAAFADAGMSVNADLTAAGAVRLYSSAYGASASISVASTGTGLGLGGTSGTGTDVAGTIGGQAASGAGQTLTSSTGASKGLALTITASAADVAAAGGTLSLGSATYRGGAGAVLRAAVEAATGASGTITSVQKSRADMLRRMDSDIDRINRQLAVVESRLTKQYSALETAMNRLNSSIPSWPTAAA